jgi:hypothetical protein
MTDDLSLREAHAHCTRCYWDLNLCRWVCREPAGGGDRPLLDIRDAPLPITPAQPVPSLS